VDRRDALRLIERAGAAVALRTTAALILLLVLIAILAPLGTALGLLGARARSVHPLYLFFARVALALGGATLDVHGRPRVSPDRAFVVVSNHESGWDPLCLLAALEVLVIRFVVKEAIVRTPLLGRGLLATGNVLVVRTETASDVRRIEAEMQRRDPEVSMLGVRPRGDHRSIACASARRWRCCRTWSSAASRTASATAIAFSTRCRTRA